METCLSKIFAKNSFCPGLILAGASSFLSFL